jgi:hypothetical protein
MGMNIKVDLFSKNGIKTLNAEVKRLFKMTMLTK